MPASSRSSSSGRASPNGRLDEAKVARDRRQSRRRASRATTSASSRNYQRLVRLEVEKHHAVIESATPLDGATARAARSATSSAKYGADLTTEFKVTPELIGGLRIKIGSDVFDSTVRERLDRLETNLLRLTLSTFTPNHHFHEQHPARTRIPNHRPQDQHDASPTSASSAKSATASPRSKA